MLKKTIKYTDYNGVERTEDFWFNLSKAEIMEMELSTTGGLAELIQKIVKEQDAPAIIKIFKDLVLKAYGEKSPDGKRFIKSDEIATLVLLLTVCHLQKKIWNQLHRSHLQFSSPTIQQYLCLRVVLWS